VLLEIVKKDKLWRQHAFRFCKDKHLADDIVQEMYLRMHRNPKERLTEYYVVLTIKSVWLNYIKTRKKDISTEQIYYLESKESIFEPDDEQQRLLDEFKKLDWVKRELLSEVYDRSLREIEEIYPLVNYGYAYREIKKAREQILDK